MGTYETRPASYPVLPVVSDRHTIDTESTVSRFRADSQPEPRHFRLLRWGLNLDSDLDQGPRSEGGNNEVYNGACQSRRVTINGHSRQIQSLTIHPLEQDDASWEPVKYSQTADQDKTSTQTLPLTYAPWTYWSKWSYERGKNNLTWLVN